MGPLFRYSLLFVCFLLIGCSGDGAEELEEIDEIDANDPGVYKIQNTLEKNQVYGPVKSIKQDIFASKTKGIEHVGLGDQLWENSDNYLDEYDDSGCLITRTFYDKNGVKGTKSITYLPDNQIDKIVFEGTQINYSSEYGYNNKGWLMSVNHINKNKMLSYTLTKSFDEAGRLTKNEYYYPTDDRTEEITYTTDDEGNILTITDPLLTTLERNEDGIIIKSIAEQNTHETIKTYNEYGHMMTMTTNYIALGTPSGSSLKVEVEYEYDEHNNWVKQIHRNFGMGEFVYTREIVYY